MNIQQMTPQQLVNLLQIIERRALAELATVQTLDQLDAWRKRWLGKRRRSK